jgi:hypothetical protein
VPVISAGAASTWHCADGRPIDVQLACDHEYTTPSTAVALDSNDAYSWRCQPRT